MRLNDLRDNPGARGARKRVGRGIGSGTGKTAGRGHKGQKSRSGVALKGFEGGQMPIHRRMPKRGFNNIFAKRYVAINLDRLQQAIDAKALDPKQPIDAAALKAAGVVKNPRDGIRLLARGELKTKITINVAGASKKAAEAVEKAGGSLSVVAAADAGQPESGKAAAAKGTAAKGKAAKDAPAEKSGAKETGGEA